jgi:hypothetical protein
MQRLRRQIIVSVAAVVAAVSAGGLGCGGGEGDSSASAPLTKVQFVKAADEISKKKTKSWPTP